jgi:hypothetical protein
MVCDDGINKSGPCLERGGVPSAAAGGVWRRAGRCDPSPAIPNDVVAVIDGRRVVYETTVVCPHCGGIKKRLDACSRCGDTGEVSGDALPPGVRDAVGAERITADDLAAVVGRGAPGTLAIVRAFPGVAARLDDEGRRRLFEAAQRHPMVALLGRTPDALVEAGGRDVLAAIAEERPRLARRSLRAKAILEIDE